MGYGWRKKSKRQQDDWLEELSRDAKNVTALIQNMERELIFLRRNRLSIADLRMRMDRLIVEGFNPLNRTIGIPAQNAAKLNLAGTDQDLLAEVANVAGLLRSIEVQLLGLQRDLNLNRIDQILEGFDLVKKTMGIQTVN